ncbi:hypothetical protein HPB49_024863 [Dermacentor silvarum]|uniref:Uncharacterized protein n=1 Tax=Dermacentor silvarum TaxID=543639 RepID=A0ACB8DH20_DERSI|nr:hypothetical protein HPB49_024863 [Dermacentor silvarum]
MQEPCGVCQTSGWTPRDSLAGSFNAPPWRELRVLLAVKSTSAPGALPSVSGELPDMSTTTAPKRHRRKKLKFKMSFGSASRGSSLLPSNMKPSPPELFALQTLKQKPNEDECRCDVARNAREAATSKPYLKGELFTTPRTTSSSDSSKPSERKQYEASASEVFENQTSFIGEEQVIVCEKRKPKALTESTVVDIVKQLRESLQEYGPSQEDDLLKALSPSKAQQIVEVYGTLAAFLDRHPGFRVLHEHLYSFIYYQHPDDQDDECDCSSLVHEGASTGSCLASTNVSGRQYPVARDDESRIARASSPSCRYYGATVDGHNKEQENRRKKNGSAQVPSLPRCKSRTLQAVQKTCDAQAQTLRWDPARFTELQSKLIKCDAEVAELKERLRTIQGSHTLEAQQLCVTIEKLRKGTPQAPPRNVAEETNNRLAMDEQRPTGSNGARAQVIPEPPRSPLRQVSTPASQALGEAARTPHWRKATSIDKKFSKSAKRSPMQKLHELPGRKKQVAGTRSDGEFKSKAKRAISKIVQMVKRQQSDYTDHEIRWRVDQLRRSGGGFSQMTLNAIAALLIGHLKAEPPKNH